MINKEINIHTLVSDFLGQENPGIKQKNIHQNRSGERKVV